MKEARYVFTHHTCRFCGIGRILKRVDHGFVTCGGNPLWQCSHCDNGGAHLSVTNLCYCGFKCEIRTNAEFQCALSDSAIGAGWKTFKKQYNLLVLFRNKNEVSNEI